jgi:peptidoglycan/LPS O-acetylase OafA/YrhL
VETVAVESELSASEATAAGPLLTDLSPEEPRRHWPALDGLRAVAVLAVILYHIDIFQGGYLGLDLFFVLSGFLITSLLITEWDARSRVSFRDFYARRALRLFPALGCVIAASVIAGVILVVTRGSVDRAYVHATLVAIPWVVAFAGNWVRAFDSNALISSLGALGQTWSLAVEEQFYLLWPILFVLVMRRRMRRDRIALVLAFLAVAEMIYRAAMAHLGYGQDRIYYATDTNCDGLLIGCAVAFWLAHPPARPRLAGRATKAIAWLAAAVLAALFLTGSRSGAPIETSAAVLASGIIVAAVATGRTPDALQRLLSSRTAIFIGRRSYGLYLWNYLLLAVIEALFAPYHDISLAGPGPGQIIFFAAMVAGTAVSFLLADVSYRRVELPALRLKRHFQRARGDQ